MRATQSQDTILNGTFVPDEYIVRVVDPGAAGVDLFVLGIFAWALMGFANVYYGNAQHVLDLTIEAVKNKKSLAIDLKSGIGKKLVLDLARQNLHRNSCI